MFLCDPYPFEPIVNIYGRQQLPVTTARSIEEFLATSPIQLPPRLNDMLTKWNSLTDVEISSIWSTSSPENSCVV